MSAREVPALMAARATVCGGAACGGAPGGPRELVRAAPPGSRAPAASLRDRTASGPGARRPLRSDGARGAVEAESASTHYRGAHEHRVGGGGGVAGGGPGPVERPGPVPPLHDEIEGKPMQDTTPPDWGGDWRDVAVCRETDPELFFPTAPRGRVYEEQVAAAKSVCARCPVRAQCLADALVGMPVGIAGGLTEAERRGLGPGLRRTASGAVGEVRAGASAREVARAHGVSERTAQRWAARARAGQDGHAAVGAS